MNENKKPIFDRLTDDEKSFIVRTYAEIVAYKVLKKRMKEKNTI